MTSPKHHSFMAVAKTLAQEFSKDPSSKIAALFVNDKNRIVSHGYNGFPSGVFDDEALLLDRPKRLLWTIHAEINGIINTTSSLSGTRVYITKLFPCIDCAKALAQAGVVEVIIEKEGIETERWLTNYETTMEMFNQLSIRLTVLEPR